MPPREITLPRRRNPQMAGGERDTQQGANQLKSAAQPARQQQEAQQPFVDLTPGSSPEGVEFDDTPPANPLPSYGNEDEEFLFGMTDRPDEAVPFGLSQSPQPPKNVYRYLSVLAQAAEDPNAPAELHAFIRILQESLSAGN